MIGEVKIALYFRAGHPLGESLAMLVRFSLDKRTRYKIVKNIQDAHLVIVIIPYYQEIEGLVCKLPVIVVTTSTHKDVADSYIRRGATCVVASEAGIYDESVEKRLFDAIEETVTESY